MRKTRKEVKERYIGESEVSWTLDNEIIKMKKRDEKQKITVDGREKLFTKE